jgi:hypothetical protein
MRRRLSKAQLALVHVARAQLGIEEGAYRALLSRVAGVSSAAELGREKLDAVLTELRRLGWHQRPAQATVTITGPRHGTMASDRQLAFIAAMWADWSDGAGDRALDRWLERTVKVSSARFLTRAAAGAAIDGLKAMVARKRGAAAKVKAS